jgi:hypothetical protein
VNAKANVTDRHIAFTSGYPDLPPAHPAAGIRRGFFGQRRAQRTPVNRVLVPFDVEAASRHHLAILRTRDRRYNIKLYHYRESRNSSADYHI